MEPTTWTSFHCSDADFTVRSVPDGDAFRVQKACLAQGSDVFRKHRPPPARPRRAHSPC